MANTGQQRIGRSPGSPSGAGLTLRDAPRMAIGTAGSRERFGQYVLTREIRTGGMAELFEAHHVDRPDDRVAIKRLLPAFRQDAEHLAMFQHEARISTLLSHRGIVRALDFGQVGETPFIVLEYVDGASLGAVLRACRARGEILPLPLSCHITRRVALALHHAHQLRGNDGRALSIVHRDVTPDNVLLGHDGSVKLADFGLARSELRSTHTQSGRLKGTSAYLSPEQANLEPLDGRSDIFSLGIVAYEMLTGEHLFLEHNDFDTLERVRHAHVGSVRDKNPRVPVELEHIVRHTLARLPDARFSDGQALARALAKLQLLSNLTCLEADVACYMRSYSSKSAGRTDAPGSRSDSTGLHAFDGLVPVSTISTVGETSRPPYDHGEDSIGFADTGLLRALRDDPKTDPRALVVPDPEPLQERPYERAQDREDPTLPFATAFAEAEDGDEPTQVRMGASDETPEERLRLVCSAPAADGKPSPFPPAEVQQPTPAFDSALAAPQVAPRPPPPAPARRAPRTRDPITLVLGVAALVALTWAGWLWLHPLAEGTLRLSTVPADAHVFFDGVEIGSRSPHVIESVDASSTHTIAVNKPGYRQWRTTLRMRPGQVLELPPIRLPRDRLAPPLEVVAEDADRAPESVVRPTAMAETPLSAADEEPAREEARPRARKMSVHFGTLRINSRPWSRVHVDGRFVGNTPLARVKLRAGRHRVVLSNAKFGLRRQLSVAIRPGQTTTEVVELSK